MVAYFMTECILNHNLHKNQVCINTFVWFIKLTHIYELQGQCLINVGGDVVFVSYNEES